MKICLAASAGGHLTQLLKINGVCQGYDVFYVSSVDVVLDKLQKFGRTYIVGECNREHVLRTITVLFKTLKIIIKERPGVVISTVGNKFSEIQSLLNNKNMSIVYNASDAVYELTGHIEVGGDEGLKENSHYEKTEPFNIMCSLGEVRKSDLF